MPVAPNRSGGGFAGLWPLSRCSQWFSIAGRMARDARLSATRSGTIICMIGRRQKLRNMTAMITLLVSLGLMACGSPEPTTPYLAPSGLAQPAPAEPQPQPQQPSTESLTNRLEALDRAVARWQGASTLRSAHEAAEEARNLVVGSSGPFYGDANGDGRISGASSLGILPGLKGERSLARRDDNACVVADVLGWQLARTRKALVEAAKRDCTVDCCRKHLPCVAEPSTASSRVGVAYLEFCQPG